MSKYEKYMIQKGRSISCYTGKLTILKDGRIQIDTIKGEVMKFWKEQLLSSEEINDHEVAENGKE